MIWYDCCLGSRRHTEEDTEFDSHFALLAVRIHIPWTLWWNVVKDDQQAFDFFLAISSLQPNTKNAVPKKHKVDRKYVGPLADLQTTSFILQAQLLTQTQAIEL